MTKKLDDLEDRLAKLENYAIEIGLAQICLCASPRKLTEDLLRRIKDLEEWRNAKEQE